jgi:hypothetical protein
LLSLPDGVVYRASVPDDDVSYRVSAGGMLFLVHGDGRCSLLDPFSRDTAAHQYVDADRFYLRTSSSHHPAAAVYSVCKVVLMRDHIVTVSKRSRDWEDCLIAIRARRQSTTHVEVRWTPPLVAPAFIVDIALLQGKLYILVERSASHRDLYAMDIAMGDDGKQHANLERIFRARIQYYAPSTAHHYLVASNDRLLMVTQESSRGAEAPTFVSPPLFDVFEATDLSSGSGQWSRVRTLMGRALFLSEGCSESLPAGQDQCSGGPQEDHIYYLSERNRHIPGSYEWQGLASGMYNMRRRTLSPLPFQPVVAQDGPEAASWLFPYLSLYSYY